MKNQGIGYPSKDETAEEINELLGDRLSFTTQMVLRERLTLVQLLKLRDELLVERTVSVTIVPKRKQVLKCKICGKEVVYRSGQFYNDTCDECLTK